jgi:hypothetical protein
MENRRNFLRQSGMATAAFIFTKPSENITSLPGEWFSPVVRKVKLLYGNALFLPDKKALHVNTALVAPGASAAYRIQKKNGVLIGFIDGKAVNAHSEQTLIQVVNNTAAQLKKQGCQLVAFVEDESNTSKSVCEMLANSSKHLDILFSKENARPHIPQRIYLNAQAHEVIVSYLPAQGTASTTCFGFDAHGKKNFFETGSQA